MGNGFVHFLEKALNTYYLGWRSDVYKYDLGVEPKTIRRWVDNRVRPQPAKLKHFLEKAFPDSGRRSVNLSAKEAGKIKEELLNLYNKNLDDQDNHRPKDDPSLKSLFIQSIDKVVNTFISINRPEQAKMLLEFIESQLILKKANPSYFLYFAMMRIEVLRRMGKVEEANQLLRSDHLRKIAGDNQNDDPQITAEWYHRNALVNCWILGRYEDSQSDLDLAKGLFRKAGDMMSVYNSQIGIAYNNMYLGELDLAESTLRQLLKRLRKNDNSNIYLKAIACLAVVYISKGLLDKAMQYVNEHLEIAQEINNRPEIGRALGNRGIVRLHLNQWDEAILDLRQDIELSLPESTGQICALLNLSVCYKHCGQSELAFNTSRDALQVTLKKNYLPHKIIALRSLAECHPQKKESKSLLDNALMLCKGVRLLDEAGCMFSLVQLSENQEERTKYWHRGAEILSQIEATSWLHNRSVDNPPFLPLL